MNPWHASCVDKTNMHDSGRRYNGCNSINQAIWSRMRPKFIHYFRKEQFQKSKGEKANCSHHRRQSGNKVWHQSEEGQRSKRASKHRKWKLIDTGLQKNKEITHTSVSPVCIIYILTTATFKHRASAADAAEHTNNFFPDLLFRSPFISTLKPTRSAISLLSSPHVLQSGSRSETVPFFTPLRSCCTLHSCVASKWECVLSIGSAASLCIYQNLIISYARVGKYAQFTINHM